ncbi:hypothetical protein ABIB29_002723 [Arthrobacter sp. UYEF36]
MDGTVRCRYSGAPFCPPAFPANERTPSAPAALHAAPARPAGPLTRRKPSPHALERPP